MKTKEMIIKTPMKNDLLKTRENPTKCGSLILHTARDRSGEFFTLTWSNQRPCRKCCIERFLQPHLWYRERTTTCFSSANCITWCSLGLIKHYNKMLLFLFGSLVSCSFSAFIKLSELRTLLRLPWCTVMSAMSANSNFISI